MYTKATYWAKFWWLLSIFIKFEDFLLTWNNFSFDSVKIYDGTSIQSPSLGEYCGNSIPTSLVSTNNQLFLKFKTDFSVNGKGFMIEYSPASRLQKSINWTSLSFLCLFLFLELLILKRKHVYDILGNRSFPNPLYYMPT